jgi:hypothetical protein
MRQTPEQHLKAARELSRQAKAATDPKQKQTLDRLAMQRRFVAKAARNKEAKTATREALERAQKSASRG